MSKKISRRGRGLSGAELPLKGGLLDAYTESTAVQPGMSDSDRFKEGYTKKSKKGAKTTQPRKSESEKAPPVQPQQEAPPAVKDDEVVDSWEDIEAEAMPVPIKVKQALRKEEKRNKAKMQQQKVAPAPDLANEQTDKITEGIKAMKLEETAPIEENVEIVKEDWEKKSDEVDQKQVLADREAKKAAKAAAKAAAAEKKKSDKDKAAENFETPVEKDIKAGEAKHGDDPVKCDNDSKTKAIKESGTDSAQDCEIKSKAELKAERRAKQEAQRAAKAQAQALKAKASEGPTTDKEFSKHPKVSDDVQADRECVEKKIAKKLASQQVPARTKAQRKVQLFSHLHQYEREISATRNLALAGGNLHPLVLQLGLQYAEGTVAGSEARSVALLTALKTVISEYLATSDKSVDKTSNEREEKDVRKDLETILSPNITFLKNCRPLAISMQNAIRFLKKQISNIDRDLSNEAIKDALEERIEAFIHENIQLAAEQISMTAASKINDGDVILTYSNSNLIEKVLVAAAELGKKFKVIVCDGRVRRDGRSLAVRLAAAGIHTTYILITAVTAVLPQITKVLLGCHGVFANGCVMAHIGSSQVALMAKSAGKPVLFCCETYKFTEKVQTDSFVYNELADPDELVNTNSNKEPLNDWRDYSSLCLLNLMYDVTPASLVDAVITEISIIPTTSVPVILRLKHTEGSLVA